MNKFYKNNKQIIWTIVVMLAIFFVFSGFFNQGRLGSFSSGMALEQKAHDDYDGARMVSLSSDEGLAEVYFDESERKIKYNANVNLESNDYDLTKQVLNQIPDQFEGFYTYQNEYKRTYSNKDYRTYSLTFKVPVDKFDEVINAVKEIGEVKSLNVQASDLTTQYNDAQAYLDSYKKEKVKIESLLARAESIDEIILIESKLTDLQRQIDNYQRQVTNINRQTDYSQVTVILEEKRPVTEVFYQWTGIKQHLRNVVQGFDSILVLITSVFAWAIAVLVIWGIVKWVRR